MIHLLGTPRFSHHTHGASQIRGIESNTSCHSKEINSICGLPANGGVQSFAIINVPPPQNAIPRPRLTPPTRRGKNPAQLDANRQKLGSMPTPRRGERQEACIQSNPDPFASSLQHVISRPAERELPMTEWTWTKGGRSSKYRSGSPRLTQKNPSVRHPACTTHLASSPLSSPLSISARISGRSFAGERGALVFIHRALVLPRRSLLQVRRAVHVSRFPAWRQVRAVFEYRVKFTQAPPRHPHRPPSPVPVPLSPLLTRNSLSKHSIAQRSKLVLRGGLGREDRRFGERSSACARTSAVVAEVAEDKDDGGLEHTPRAKPDAFVSRPVSWRRALLSAIGHMWSVEKAYA
ncbi:hypothetical protein C8J57DRAFT_1241716 [Mycena rebaudengoi]|nr:hypothetical protein C8J57DRAFT_1241716 [Mycena rebaudengoi]